jgi:hypothetical protein
MSENKKLRVEFAPGAFDHFDGTQEELDAMVAEIQRMAESGELEENSRPFDDESWQALTEEEREIISSALDGLDHDLTRLR